MGNEGKWTTWQDKHRLLRFQRGIWDRPGQPFLQVRKAEAHQWVLNMPRQMIFPTASCPSDPSTPTLCGSRSLNKNRSGDIAWRCFKSKALFSRIMGRPDHPENLWTACNPTQRESDFSRLAKSVHNTNRSTLESTNMSLFSTGNLMQLQRAE